MLELESTSSFFHEDLKYVIYDHGLPFEFANSSILPRILLQYLSHTECVLYELLSMGGSPRQNHERGTHMQCLWLRRVRFCFCFFYFKKWYNVHEKKMGGAQYKRQIYVVAG